MSMSLIVAARRRTIRAIPNPMDKSTVVSIYPKDIHEVKHTIQPGVFDIPAGSVDKPSLLIVGPSSWWKEIDEEQPLLEIPHYSTQVADSIVKDYCNGILGCSMGIAMPGLYYVPGEHDVASIKSTKFLSLFLHAQSMQKTFWQGLVKMADSMWARTNGNPLSVSEDMRMAARELGLVNKDWMSDHTASENIRCVACGAMRNPLYPICGSCHTIVDKNKALELGLLPAPEISQNIKTA